MCTNKALLQFHVPTTLSASVLMSQFHDFLNFVQIAINCLVFFEQRGVTYCCWCSRVASVQCGDCGQVLDTIYKLQIHQLRAHNKGKLFSCHHCSFKSPRKKDVQGLSSESSLLFTSAWLTVTCKLLKDLVRLFVLCCLMQVLPFKCKSVLTHVAIQKDYTVLKHVQYRAQI